MNFPRYKFAKESEPELLQFLQVAKNANAHKYVDFRKHQLWKQLLPPNIELLDRLEKSINENITVIDDSSTELILEKNARKFETLETELEENYSSTSTNDLVFTVKENLETLNELSQSAKDSIINCPVNKQEELFKLLNENLNTEEIFYLGESLQTIGSNDLITIFCHLLLIPQIQQEYNERLSTLIDNLYNSKYFLELHKEILNKLGSEINERDIKICLQYLNNIHPNYKYALLRDFIFEIEALSNHHLLIVEILLNNKLGYEALNKLVQLLSNIAEDHVSDKIFGKVLMNVIQCLGTNVLQLEQPLKHIIAGHKSIWKPKLDRTFQTHYDDTLMFSQNFRD